MNSLKYLFGAGLIVLSSIVQASDGTKTLASTIEVYVFPTMGQDSNQQSQDEAECYQWAVDNAGNDPFNLAKQEAASQQSTAEQIAIAETSTQGSGAQGAVKGAIGGALIGEIANDDAAQGAAWGAAVGGISNRRRARRAKQQTVHNAEVQQEQHAESTTADLDKFNKAFSVCLEAKSYLVKY